MNFVNLKYFLTVAEERNITKAAERLYISQQSLSNHIQRLEKYYDTELFERKPALTLTYSGRCLQQAAIKILSIEKQVTDEIDDINHQLRGELKIGIPYTRGRLLLPDILPIYRKNMPLVELHVIEGNTFELCQRLKNSDIDLFIGHGPIPFDDIITIPLLQERLFLCVPENILISRFPQVPLESFKTMAVSVEDFLNCPFLVMTSGNQIRKVMDQYLSRCKIHPNILLETKNIETLLSLCGKGMGITFYPEMFVQHILNKERDSFEVPIYYFPISDNSTITHLVIGHRKEGYLSRATKEFISIVLERWKET